MIRILVRFGRWLDQRFPEKLVVTTESYTSLQNDIQSCKALISQVDLLVQRLSVVEKNAVHKDAVSDLIKAVKALKDEYVSLKASFGMSRIGDSDIRAMLNGHPIQGDDNV